MLYIREVFKLRMLLRHAINFYPTNYLYWHYLYKDGKLSTLKLRKAKEVVVMYNIICWIQTNRHLSVII